MAGNWGNEGVGLGIHQLEMHTQVYDYIASLVAESWLHGRIRNASKSTAYNTKP